MDPDLDRKLSALMSSAQDGDRSAYDALLGETAKLVRRFVRRRLAHKDLVDDVTQDILLTIHRYRHTYDPTRPFCPWIYAIARNRLYDRLRELRRQREREVPEAEGGTRVDPAPPLDSQRTRLLEQAFALLTTVQREIILLLKFDGYSVAEVAQQTGRSQASVKVTAHRGYVNLRRAMERIADDE